MRYYTNKEIKEFIRCPQFGDTYYGKWGALPIEVRQVVKQLISINECMDELLKGKLFRIEKAICFLNTEYNTYTSGEEWRKALIKILNGDVNDEKE